MRSVDITSIDESQRRSLFELYIKAIKGEDNQNTLTIIDGSLESPNKTIPAMAVLVTGDAVAELLNTLGLLGPTDSKQH